MALMRTTSVALATLTATAMPAAALPDLDTRQQAGDMIVYGDHEKPNLFYAVPEGIMIRTLEDGGPDLNFSIARYTGSSLRDDSGTIEILSVLRIGLERIDPSAERLREAEDVLAQTYGRNIDLRVLSIARLEARPVIATADTPTDVETAYTYDDSPIASAGWRERNLYMAFSPQSAELVETYLNSDAAAMSLAWSLEAKGWREPQIEGSVRGSGEDMAEAARELAEKTGEMLDEALPEEGPVIERVVGDAIVIELTPEERKNRMTRFDVDAAMPPSYPSLAAYCFTFDNDLREDLYERRLEIEAAAAAGGTTGATAVFRSTTPSDYAETIRFQYAANIREPYRWKIVDTLMTGEQVETGWQTSSTWTRVIDITNLPKPPEASLNEDAPEDMTEES